MTANKVATVLILSTTLIIGIFQNCSKSFEANDLTLAATNNSLDTKVNCPKFQIYDSAQEKCKFDPAVLEAVTD